MKLIFLATLFFISAAAPIWGAKPKVPLVEEWPPLESAPTVAEGFQPATWAEFQWRNETWEPTQRRTWSYSSSAQPDTIRQESWFMDKWQTSQLETMTYDRDGRLTEKLRQETVGVALHNRARSTYDHRDPATLREDMAAWSHEQRWLPFAQEVLVYDGAGRLTQHSSHRRQGNISRGIVQILHRYDAAGRRIESLKQRDQGGKWINAERMTFTYDAQGRLTQATLALVGKGGPGWIEMMKVTHEYDGSGRRSASVQYSRGPTDALEPKVRQLHFHDDHGNQIEKRYQMRRDGTWIDARKETFAHQRKP